MSKVNSEESTVNTQMSEHVLYGVFEVFSIVAITDLSEECFLQLLRNKTYKITQITVNNTYSIVVWTFFYQDVKSQIRTKFQFLTFKKMLVPMRSQNS